MTNDGMTRATPRNLRAVLGELVQAAAATYAVLSDSDGNITSLSGSRADLDPQRLASLAAEQLHAADGLAKLIGESEFSILHHEAGKDQLHFAHITPGYLLVIVFDEGTSLGKVRLASHKYVPELARLVGS